MNAFLKMYMLPIEKKFTIIIKAMPPLPKKDTGPKCFCQVIISNLIILIILSYSTAEQKMESSPIHPAKQNKPDIKHGKETILKYANAMSEIKFNIILNKSSTTTQGGQRRDNCRY